MDEADELGAPVAGEAPVGYTVVRELGTGRLGRVLVCTSPSGSRVVVRVLAVRPVDTTAQARLEAELRAAAAAGQHACAAQISRVWTDPDLGICLEQAFGPGGSAQAVLAADGPFDPAEVTIGGLRLAAALASSHARGVLHGDLRPANVLLDENKDWLLADGGVARAVRRADPSVPALLDPLYAPRELYGWEEPGPPADVYSLGATLYAMLSGHPPGAEDSRRGAGAQYAGLLVGPAPLPPAVPAPLAGLVLRMLAPDPADRPPLTEVDQILRAQVPAAARSRIPDPSHPAPPSLRLAPRPASR